jgi:diguanylate cyclase (GGDEF)-like protein/PAS domain S-box-containing protein
MHCLRVVEKRRGLDAPISDAAGARATDGPARDQARQMMARVLFWLYAGGAALALLALPVSGYLDEDDVLGVVAVCAAAAAACVALRVGSSRLPMWSFHALLALGTACVTFGIYLGRDTPGSAQLLYVWVALYAAYFFTRAQALAHVAFAAVLYAAVLPTTPAEESHVALWVLVVGVLIATTILVSALKRRLDRRIARSERSERDLEQSLSLLRATLESTADGILVVDNEGRIVSFNRRFKEMWRIPDDVVSPRDDQRALAFVLDQVADPELFQAKVMELYSRPGAESYDVIQFKDGRVFERYSQPQRSANGDVYGRVWSFRDVTDRERIQSQLRHLADHDVLTGLLNRRRFEEELERQVAHEARYGTGGAVLILDLDDFKDVNDTLGHRTGDALISSVAGLLADRLRESDVLARLGGDEFAVLLPTANTEQARLTATALLEAVRRHRLLVGGRNVRITTSIGGSMVGEAGATTAEDLMVRADVAMYEAKESGRDRVHFHRPGAELMVASEVPLTRAERIRNALEQDRLDLYAQPVVELAGGEVCQYELLLRMSEPGGELVPPRGFLPSAERSGMMPEIDSWVVARAIELIDERAGEGRELRLEVNLSPRSIGDEDLLGAIEQQLGATGIDPGSLVFEVAETAAISNLEQVRSFAEALRAMGCRFALDDFGGGFGSFHYLRYLPLDYLKIDGDFIANVATNPADQAVVRAIVDLSGRLGKQTIAEFVGDDETFDLLRGYGVDYAQGFHVGRPAPVSEMLNGNHHRDVAPRRAG